MKKMSSLINGKNDKTNKWNANFKYFLKNKYLYLLLLPGIAFYIIFRYVPMYGVIIAFKDFSIYKGIIQSPFNNFEHFKVLFQTEQFYRILRNSVLLGLLKLVFNFPAPIIVALLLNEIGRSWFKRSVQTIIYMPHFLSWVIVGGLVISFLDPTDGILNVILKKMGKDSIFFLTEARYFRGILVLSNIWKEMGWGTIIYLSAITSINPQLYEAASIDGANRFRQMLNITLPCIMSTVIVILIINTGYILRNSFEQVFVLYNPLVYEVGDVFETYIYRVGLIKGDYGYSAAVGVFQSIVGMLFLLTTNKLANRFGEGGGII